MPVGVAFETPPVAIAFEQLGDRLSKLPFGALGGKGHDGIGNRPGCCGIGDGDDGPSGMSYGPGHSASFPQLIYKVEPEFSEEARKAKYSGVVLLEIEVDSSGRPRGFRVLASPGLGLDQKAIDAVRQWRFRPGYRDGRPVVTQATVEVSFRLL